MNRKILTLIAASALVSLSGPAWALHGDCIANASSGTQWSIPEVAGLAGLGDSGDIDGGLRSAIDTGNTPLSWVGLGGIDPCDDPAPTFPATDEIPGGANADPNASGAPYGSGGNSP